MQLRSLLSDLKRLIWTFDHPIYVGQSETAPSIRSGAGTPEGAVTAPVGALYLRTDGGATTTLYVKTSGTGNTGWTGK